MGFGVSERNNLMELFTKCRAYLIFNGLLLWCLFVYMFLGCCCCLFVYMFVFVKE